MGEKDASAYQTMDLKPDFSTAKPSIKQCWDPTLPTQTVLDAIAHAHDRLSRTNDSRK